MYIEQRLENLAKAINDLRVDNADRLARIETTQEATNEHLKQMNGSIAKSVERIGQLEAQDKLTALGIAGLSGTVETNEKDIALLKVDATYSKGKTAGIALVISTLGTIVTMIVGWLFRHPHITH